MSGTSAFTIVSEMRITVPSPFSIYNTVEKKPIVLNGNYIAIPQLGSHPLAYDLFEADSHWIRNPEKIANVFISVDEKGVAHIS